MCSDDSTLSRRLLLVAAAIPMAATLTGCTEHPAAAADARGGRTGHPVTAAAAVRTPGTAAAADLGDPASARVVVDKHRPLQPKSWVPHDLAVPDVRHTNPPQLRRAAARSLEDLFQAAGHAGVTLVSLSAYRPYTVQRRIYDRNLRLLGRPATERLTLRPGYSEHQTGLAVDLGGASRSHDLDVAFADTAESRWMSEHAWRWGWLLRYERGRKAVTGIQYEPWHYRWVGRRLAAAYRRAGAHSLEQYFGLPAAPDYR